jgi:hypothetical protein
MRGGARISDTRNACAAARGIDCIENGQWLAYSAAMHASIDPESR